MNLAFLFCMFILIHLGFGGFGETLFYRRVSRKGCLHSTLGTHQHGKEYQGKDVYTPHWVHTNMVEYQGKGVYTPHWIHTNMIKSIREKVFTLHTGYTPT